MKKTNKRGSRAEKLLTLLILALVSAAVLLIYRVTMRFAIFEVVFWVYLALSAALILTFVIYNRGFARRGVTAQMLPEEWSPEKKEEYIADGERRLRRSRWMLIPILAFVFTFFVDVIELFALPFFSALFGGNS